MKYEEIKIEFSPELIEQMSEEVQNIVELKTELDTGWPWPLDAVQGWFEDLYNLIFNLPATVWNWIQEHLIEPIVNWILDAAWWIYQIFQDSYTAAIDEIENFPDPWKWFLLPFATFKHFMLKNVVQPVTDFIMGGLNSIVEGIRSVFDPIIEPILNFINNVISFFTEQVPNFFNNLGSWFQGVVEQLSNLPNILYDLFTNKIPAALSAAASAIWNWINENIIPPLRNALNGAWNTLQGLFQELIEMVFGYFEGVKNTIEDGNIVDAITQLLPIIGTGFGIAVALDVMSIKIMGSGIDIKAVKDFITSLIDPKMVFSIFLGVLSATTIKKPLEYWARSTFRTTIPSPGDLIKFYKLNILSKNELYANLAKHGYSDYWIDMYEYSAWELPRFADVYAAYVRGTIDDDDFNKWLSILNIKTEPRPDMTVPDIEIFKEGLYRMPSPFYLVYAAETGALSVDDLKNILRDSLYHPKYIDMLASSIWKRTLLDDIREATRAIISEFLSWTLSYDEAVEALRSIGRRDEEIEVFMPFYEDMQSKKIRSKALSEYEKMYRRGYISKEEFINKLVNVGLNPEIVEAYANLLEEIRSLYDMIKETMDERRALATTLQKLYKLGFLSEDDLRSKLQELGFMDTEIDLRVERSTSEYNSEITDLWIDYYKELLRHGLIDPDSFKTSLVNLGMSEEKADALAEYYSLKYQYVDQVDLTKDERRSLASTLLKLYRYGALSGDELATRLAELGFSDDEINFMIERGTREYEYSIKDIKLDILIEQMKQGLIDRATFVNNCVDIGFSAEKCEAWAELYYTRYIGIDYYVLTKDERRSLASTLLRLYKYGRYSKDEVRSKLSQLGFTDREIDLMIERANIEAEYEQIEYLIKFYDELLLAGTITQDEYINSLTQMGIRQEMAEARALYILRKEIARGMAG
ncbi:MAG: hypothetical protein DRJ60_04000 [Thermoprotei archaeon]|nr:MAG: hypothetical protein DRJ60_04000 [Thermoprotei archaeon]